MTAALENMGIAAFAAWILALSMLRYWVIAGLPYLVLYVMKPRFSAARKVQAAFPPAAMVRFEFFWGNVSSALIAATLILAFAGWKAGYAKIYTDEGLFGAAWYYGSIVAMAAIHDAWFYWTHRLLHHPLFFRRFHATHHRSLNPTPWASLSFHPVEEVLSFGFFPLMVFVLPFHPVPLAYFFSLMFAGNVSGHSGFELGRLTPLSRYLGGALIHNLHHTRVTKNFGLYTNLWDHLCGTFDESFAAEFRRLEAAGTKASDEEPKSPRDAPPRAG